MNQLIYVVEWPRSGGTWLHDCIADCMPDFEVAGGYQNCRDRNSRGYVFRVHILPNHEYTNTFPPFTNPYIGYGPGAGLAYRAKVEGADLKIVVLSRDPRDAAVSQYFMLARHDKRFDIETFSLEDYLEQIFVSDRNPGLNLTEGGWKYFYREWMKASGVIWARHEDLIASRYTQIMALLSKLDCRPSIALLNRAIAHYESQERAPYGLAYAACEPQRQSVKSGTSRWQRHFSARAIEMMRGYWGPIMERLGYHW